MITNDIKYIGVNDSDIDLFEGQYEVPNGISYNSYIILDEKIAVMDTVDVNFKDEWLNNIKKTLIDKTPDFLIVLHMEPDHSANILNFMVEYPTAKIVSSSKSFAMMKNYFDDDFIDRRIIVNEGDTLSLGKHILSFYTAPMVHWPEVIVAYDTLDKVLFSADGFGKFGSLDINEEWVNEARRYYIGIVGKYGAQVQGLLRKAQNLDIKIICPLHGPVLKANLGYYLDLYNKWSSYQPEEKGIVIAYASIYGNTKKAALKLEELIKLSGYNKVELYDLARCDIHKAIAAAFKYDKLVLASPTYNADIFPIMKFYIDNLVERNYQNRIVAFIENGSWAPMATKVMKQMLEKSKNITFSENNVKILSSLNEVSTNELKVLADYLVD